jgi:hypothetical protein
MALVVWDTDMVYPLQQLLVSLLQHASAAG